MNLTVQSWIWAVFSGSCRDFTRTTPNRTGHMPVPYALSVRFVKSAALWRTALRAYLSSTISSQSEQDRQNWESFVYIFNLSPIEDINTDWLRSHLRYVLSEVNHGARYAILRRGQPVAGLVPITEARALFEATRADRKYREIHEGLKRRDEDRLRQAVADLGQAESALYTGAT